MGYIRHHAIIVTGYDIKKMNKHKKFAKNLGLLVSNVIISKINGYMSFFIAPDGSKEGWKDSNLGDDRRCSFIEYIKLQGDSFV